MIRGAHLALAVNNPKTTLLMATVKFFDPIRAESVAAPRDCRARPAWSRGHSLPGRNRDTPPDTCGARPAPRRGSIDPHRSYFLRGRGRDRRPKCRLEASPTDLLLVRPPHKARRRPRRLFAEQRTPAEIIVLLRPDELAHVRMQVLAHRRAVVDHRIDQMLKCKFWSLLVAGVKCVRGRETSASAIIY